MTPSELAEIAVATESSTVATVIIAVFLLLGGILALGLAASGATGGMLGLVALVFFAVFMSR